VPLAVYASSLSSFPAYWDTGEAQTVPWIFGIMHPTGFPAFTVFAGMFAHAFPFGTVAWRIGFFSALAMSGCAWLVWRIAVLLETDVWIACAAAWVFALSDVAWTRGSRAEVHALAVFFALSALCASVAWYRSGNSRLLIAGALAWGLAIATHPIAVLLFPALLVALLERINTLRAASFALAVCAFACGVSLYAYLPLRSAAVTAARLDPTLSLGLPPGEAFWDNDHPSSRQGFVKELFGAEYGAGGALARMGSFDTYKQGVPSYADHLLTDLTPATLVFALAGIVLLWRRDDAQATLLLLAFALPTAFALAYTIEADPLRYYLIGYAVISALAGYGLSRTMTAIRLPGAIRPATALLVAAALLIAHRNDFEQRTSTGSQAVIDGVVKNTPRNAILITPWIDATALAYGAYVERRLGDRIVVPSWLSENASRVPAWIHRRPVYVVGQIFGQVAGYQLLRVADEPDIYRIAPSPASPHSR
jgi:4-amino-4-deoxy-L-arabinose transferase-like glycosyltransferase